MENEIGKEVVIDIEAQTSTNEKKGNQSKKLLSKTTSGVLNYKVPKDENISSNAKHSRHDNIEVRVDNITRSSGSEERVPLIMNNIHGKEKKSKVKTNKKPWKPPRPPKGPSLTASDTKFAKEIYDLKMQRRATIKRIRALNKSRVDKSSSSGTSASTLTAMIVTIIFITIIFVQGPLSRSIPFLTNHESPQPSPEPKGLITIKFPKLSTKGNAPSNSKRLRLEEVAHHEFNSPG